MPLYFVRDHPENSGCTGRLGLADCTTASAAAPTYFQPWTIAESATSPYCESVGPLVDGAVGVTGNPVYRTYIEAFEYSPGYKPKETITVSLGNGKFKHRREPAWIGGWLEWVMAELIDWEAILAGTETRFRITGANTLWEQYRIPPMR